MRTRTVLFIMIFISFSSLFARMYRVAQLPFGYVNGCANCHVNPKGGGAWNVFGAQIEANYLDSKGNVMWGVELAQLDADNDLFTNGTELQEPTGLWVVGQALSGDKSLVSNPGDASSVPPGTFITNKEEQINPIRFDLVQNFPNPFNGVTTISFKLDRAASISIDIYSVNGELITHLINQAFEPGKYRYVWDARDSQGQYVPSGIYIYRLQAGDEQIIKSMLYLK